VYVEAMPVAGSAVIGIVTLGEPTVALPRMRHDLLETFVHLPGPLRLYPSIV
jgi:hypothetical protein